MGPEGKVISEDHTQPNLARLISFPSKISRA